VYARQRERERKRERERERKRERVLRDKCVYAHFVLYKKYFEYFFQIFICMITHCEHVYWSTKNTRIQGGKSLLSEEMKKSKHVMSVGW